MMKAEWPRGSEWRKWDLHIHAPGTKLNDQFKDSGSDVWDQYCRILNESDVYAFGITDYFSADCYFKTIEEFSKRYPDSEKIFFPNIELRLSEAVNRKAEEVHIHLIFNPSAENYEENIKSFLASLKIDRTEIRGNRNLKAVDLPKKHSYEAATTTRQFIDEALNETYDQEGTFLDFLLIITAANNDGIRAQQGKKRKLARTDEIDKFSNGFFGSGINVDHFLNRDRSEDDKEFPSKPVLSGCDAHSITALEEYLGQTFVRPDSSVYYPTWIKADLTYEGLKQIVFEPRGRVFIGERPEIERRVSENLTKYIDRLQITWSDEYRGDHGVWFRNEDIPLGKELVAIIGNKGNGKSAIIDIMGLLGNSYNQIYNNNRGNSDELFSFLNSKRFLKGGLAHNFKGTLIWHSKEVDCKLLDEQVARNSPKRVEYLPQKYLERICADTDDGEFRKTLDEVIFRYVDESNRYSLDSLRDLIEYRTEIARADIENNKLELHRLNGEVISIEGKLVPNYKREIEGKIHLKEKELEAHLTTCPPEKLESQDVDSGINQLYINQIEDIGKDIAECDEVITFRRKNQVTIRKNIENLNQAKGYIAQEADRLAELKLHYQDFMESFGLSFDSIVRLDINYEEIDRIILEKERKLEEMDEMLATKEEINDQFGGLNDAKNIIRAAQSVSVICKKEKLEEKRIKLVENQNKPEREHQTYLAEHSKWEKGRKKILGDEQNPAAASLNGLKRELGMIETNYPKNLEEKRRNQISLGGKIFQRKKDLMKLYHQIKKPIDKEIDKCQDSLVNYEISVEVGLRLNPNFIEKFLGFIHQGRKGSFQGIDEGRVMLASIINTVDGWEQWEEVAGAINGIIDALHNDQYESDNSKRDVFEQMKNGEEQLVDLYDYLFSFDYLNPEFELKVDKKDLGKLSPGERGGLLLAFYLMLDKQDIPLIIDQPEDNLDNKSVYEILVTFIKMAKKRRQIILVTHNPNLAVVADAEQIIHVKIDKSKGKPDFEFYSGSIENPIINKALLDILEGTRPAFDNRRLKYRIPSGRAKS